MKRIIALLLALITVSALTACAKDPGTSNPSDTYTADDIALSTENFSFTRAEVSYIFYQNYKSMSSDSIDVYNIDTGSSLKDQIYHDDYTWFQNIADVSVDYMKELLIYCEAAKKAGLELTDEDRQTIEDTVKTWTDYARDYEFKIEDLMRKYFNSDVNCDTIRSFMEKDILSQKYQSQTVSGYKFTDEELKKETADNPDDYNFINYLKLAVTEKECETAKATAAKLAAAKTPDEFLSLAEDYIDKYQKADDREKALSDCTVIGEKKKKGTEYSEWAFSAEENATYTDENDLDGIYTVYMLTKKPYLDTEAAKDIRILTEKISTHNSHQNTINYLNELIDKWKNNGGGEEAFADLVAKESDDSQTAELGGLYTNVPHYSDTSLSREIVEWCFDSERKAGDTGVLKYDDENYCAVYFIGDGAPAWQVNATIALGQKKMESDYNELVKLYPVQVFNEVVNSLEG